MPVEMSRGCWAALSVGSPVRCVLLVLVLVHLPALVHSFQCGHCNRTACEVPELCGGGLVVDPCGCCKECAKVDDQPCGGRFGLNGRCDEGLYCAIDPNYGSDITGDEDGVCKVIPVVVPASCVGVVCDLLVTPSCPEDSIVAGGAVIPGDCCAQPYHCQCMPCVPEEPQCTPDQLRILRNIGNGQPGQCCDTYVCQDRGAVCEAVVCDDDPYANVTCPADSSLLSPLVTQNGCCVQNAGCMCEPPDQCEIPICLPGTRPQLVEPSTGMPGRCCDHIQCVSDTALECPSADGSWRSDGETWALDACTQCTCDRGLTRCDQVSCPSLGHCGWISIPEGQCCHQCMGCTKGGQTYANGAEWQQDPCVTCYCEGGQVYCRAERCESRCTNPRYVEGICCPICDDLPHQSVIDLPSGCPSLDNCTLAPFCPRGLRQDQSGCYQCSCKDDDVTIGEVPMSCTLVCHHGYKLDDDGSELCECSKYPSTSKVTVDLTTVQPTGGADTGPGPHPTGPNTLGPKCVSMAKCDKHCAFGFRVSKDGCPKCKCNRCPPFLCQKKCLYGYTYNDNGCVLCKCRNTSVSLVTPSTDPAVAGGPGPTCLTDDGRLWEDGQSWHDHCRLCFCHLGREMCTLITCPVQRCRHPVMLQGDCCASCPDDGGLSRPALPATCRASDGQHIAEGETWYLDRCTLCICHNGEMLCEVERCPPLTCQQSVRMKDRCCPVCIDAELSMPTYLPDKTPSSLCQMAPGMVFHSGDIWRVSACQSCMCRDGQIHCYSQTCPLLTKCNKTVMRKGQCCPQCIDESPAKLCTLGLEVYTPGEQWLLNNCTRCVCHEGRVLCLETQCPPRTDCSSGLAVDACCPVCTNHSNSGEGNDGVLPDDIGAVPLRSFVTLVVVVVLLVVLVLVLLLVVAVLCWRKKKVAQHRQCERTKAMEAVFQRPPDAHVARRPKSVTLEYRGHNWRDSRYTAPSHNKLQYYDETIGLLQHKLKLSDAESVSGSTHLEKKAAERNNLSAVSVEDNCHVDCGPASDSGADDLLGDNVDKLSEFDNEACVDSSYSDLDAPRLDAATDHSAATVDLLLGTPRPPPPYTRYSINDDVWLRNTSHDKAPMADKCIRYSVGASTAAAAAAHTDAHTDAHTLCDSNTYRKSL